MKRELLLELANKMQTARIYLSLLDAHKEGLIKDTIFLYKDKHHETLFDKLKYELQDVIDYSFTDDEFDYDLTKNFYNQALETITKELGL